jgi:hypothetical protein
MKNPYAISDFEKIRLNGFEYIDRTDRIPQTENVGQYLLFLRPRRFGKSLWLSTLKNYYDLNKKDVFDRLFADLWIGKNPTPLANQYFVLKWDFSCVNCSGSNDEIEKSLYKHVNARIERFASDYSHMQLSQIKIHPTSGISSFESLLTSISKTPHQLYLFIDEYDNFANELMANKREDEYYKMTDLDGFLKTFFKSLKSATEGMGLDRMFLTGVTPILLNDITSGDNIKTDIHILPHYADLCGFTDSEIKKLIQTFADYLETKPRFLIPDDASVFPEGKNAWVETIYQLMVNLYDGYIFSPYIQKRMYNPTLVMYLLKQLEELDGQLPESLIDFNLIPDRGRLEYIAGLPGGKDLIMELNQNKRIEISKITPRFGLTDMLEKSVKTREFMGSYLYFMGMLTMGKKLLSGNMELTIPNPVTQNLYIDGLARWIIADPLERDMGFDAANQFKQQGKIAPLRQYIEKKVFPTFHWRDKRWVNELTIKTIFMCLMMDETNFLMISERQSRSGYADLAMIVRPDRRHFHLKNVLIEFKYIKTKNLKIKDIKGQSDTSLFKLKPVEKKIKEAQSQANLYSKELLEEFGHDLKLTTYAVIAIGFERLLYKKL